jgi:hypothetical protein
MPCEFALLRGRACEQLYREQQAKTSAGGRSAAAMVGGEADGGAMEQSQQQQQQQQQQLSLAERASLLVYTASLECEGLSGRALRKLPFLAHALFCGTSTMPFTQYIECLRRAAARERQCRSDMAAATDNV